nr:retrovirus-related Pol polyprotein from transposon TNT 1-94 [Tanacetum cinerariifolium]
IRIQLRDGSIFVLHNVRYIPESKRNLISLGTLKKEGFTVKLQLDKVKVINGSRVVLFRIRRDNCVYSLDGHAMTCELNASVEEKDSLAQVWHKRLGHISEAGLHVLEKQGLFGKKSLDLWGPSQVESLGGKRYFLSIVDDYSRRLRTDNGLEFRNQEFEQLCIESGIARHLTVAGTPQQNGLAERMNRTLMGKVRCLLIQSGLPNTFWAEATCTTAYLINSSLVAWWLLGIDGKGRGSGVEVVEWRENGESGVVDSWRESQIEIRDPALLAGNWTQLCATYKTETKPRTTQARPRCNNTDANWLQATCADQLGSAEGDLRPQATIIVESSQSLGLVQDLLQRKLKGRNSKIQETSQYSESRTPNKRGDLRGRLEPKRSRNVSKSPERTGIFSRIQRDQSASLRRRQGDKRRREGDVFHRLGVEEEVCPHNQKAATKIPVHGERRK